MQRVAFIFIHGPHGNSGGREGLDALLAISALSKDLGVFFIGDGVFQLLSGQEPERILAHNYIKTFGVLSLCEVEQFYLCESSMRERGLSDFNDWVLDTKILALDALRHKLNSYDAVLTF